jgi:hypothetical protein
LNFHWQQLKKNGDVEPQVELEDGGGKNVENEPQCDVEFYPAPHSSSYF